VAERERILEGLEMSAPALNAFSDRSVMVTGHTGFKGSWLALWLHRLGARVTGYALRPPTEPSHFNLARIDELLAGRHEADIRDRGRLFKAMEAAAPDVVFHLAAQALVRQSYSEPVETWDVNVMGTVAVLDCVRRLGRPCTVVVITSDKCYENREQVWSYRECDPMGGFDPYSSSKGAAELAAAAYRNSFFHPRSVGKHGVKVATARAGNVIGGGDWAADRIITDVVAALVRKEPVPVRSPRAVRPWQHVLEPLSGYLMLAARMIESDDPRWCGAWNFGPRAGDEATVSSLVDLFCSAWGHGTWKDCGDPSDCHEAQMLRLCIDKASWDLGWRPQWSLSETVRRTARWYRRVLEEKRDARAESLEDILTFTAL
jgi:CDP-glucose 4,6-dehydratase